VRATPEDAREAGRAEIEPPQEALAVPAAKACADVEDAVKFGLHRARSTAETRGVRLTRAVEAGLAAACDRQATRRIVHLAVQEALADASAGSTVKVDARRVRGTVLLRVASETRARGDEDAETAMLRSLVEDVGGTLVAERDKHNQTLSIRLGAAETGQE
jgi:hypothetical protein